MTVCLTGLNVRSSEMRYVNASQGNEALIKLNIGIDATWKTTTPA